MCPGAVVVLLVRAQHMPQMPLAKHDHMIEALASDRADQSFNVTVLPRRSRRCRSVANAHRAETTRKCLAVERTFLHADGIASIDLFVVPNAVSDIRFGSCFL